MAEINHRIKHRIAINPVFCYLKNKMPKKPKIFLSGGGTLGSVMPLLALREEIKDFPCFWVGSFRGIEKETIKKEGIKYLSIPAGKLRKYRSFKNIFAPFLILAGFIFSSIYIIWHRPSLIVVSGSFISAPLVWAGWLLRVKIIVHQEDLKIGLAGRLTIPFANLTTCAFDETWGVINHKNRYWIGNPVRRVFSQIKKEEAAAKWRRDNQPLVLFLGGGTGAQKINEAVPPVLQKLKNRAQVIHLTGRNKNLSASRLAGLWGNYRYFEYLGDELAEVMAASDLIVCRAGASTLAELAVLGKAAILIPLENVGQRENADYLERKGAAFVIDEKNLATLPDKIEMFLTDEEKKKELETRIRRIFPPASAQRLKGLTINIFKI